MTSDRSSPNICILDYGSGNVRSVLNMVSSLHPNVSISNDPDIITKSTHIILPGVGAFGSSMEKIRAKLPIAELRSNVLEQGKQFLGICVGMQVLFDSGMEFGTHLGLGWLAGEVTQIDSGELPLPHIGWNGVEHDATHPLFKGIPSGQDFYFVHSFACRPTNQSDTLAHTEYQHRFVSAVARKNIMGVQFHPEKSQNAGRALIRNFLELQ